MTNDLLKDQEHAATYKRIHEMELAKEAERKISNLASTLDTRLISPNQHYDKLCRGEVGQEPQLVAQLKCRYLTNKPFLKIAPLKLEQASLKPNLVVFHDVIYDNEIDVIQKLSKPRVNRRSNLQNFVPNNESSFYIHSSKVPVFKLLIIRLLDRIFVPAKWHG